MTAGKKRVLIVDDDREFGEFVQDVVEDVGCEGTLLTSSTNFKTTFSSLDPDVIVLDVTMPEIDGIELVKWLGEQCCEAQIIIVSGFNPIFSSVAQQLGELMGLAKPSVLLKPFEPERLQSLVMGRD